MEARLFATLLPPVTLEEASHTVSCTIGVTVTVMCLGIITSSTM